MNIFYTDHNPALAAESLPDKLVVKMPVETVQMLVSACARHHIDHNVTTKSGTVHKGGYHNHPCTVWAGDNRSNFVWLWWHGSELCQEYTYRYGKEHFAINQLTQLMRYVMDIPAGALSFPALAMPDECKTEDPVESYRIYIRHKVATKPASFVWQKTRPAPNWI